MHACVCAHVCTCVHMYISVFIHVHARVCEHTCIHTHLHTLPHPHIPPSHSLTFLFSFPLSAPSPLCALPFLFSFSSLRIDTFISLFCKEDILCSKMRLLCGECRLFLPSFRPSVRPSFFPSLFNCIDGHVCVPRSPPSGILHSTRFEIPFPFLLSSFPVFSVIRVGNFASTHYSDAPVPSFFFSPSFRFFRPCRPFRHFMFRGECVYPCLRVGTPPASPFPRCVSTLCVCVPP